MPAAVIQKSLCEGVLALIKSETVIVRAADLAVTGDSGVGEQLRAIIESFEP